MSWDSFIDNLIAYSKDTNGMPHTDRACILGLDGGAQWTGIGHTNALQFKDNESASIAAAFKSKDFTSFMSSGIVIEGIKYQFLKQEDGKLVLGKKKDEGAVTLQASKTAIVIAHTKEGSQQGNTNKAVGIITQYLETLNM